MVVASIPVHGAGNPAIMALQTKVVGSISEGAADERVV